MNRLLTSILLLPTLFFMAAPVQAATVSSGQPVCCLCRGPAESQDTCLTTTVGVLSGTLCAPLPAKIGSTMDGWTCTENLGAPDQGKCRTVAENGVCQKGIIRASEATSPSAPVTSGSEAVEPPAPAIIPNLNVEIPGFSFIKDPTPDTSSLLAQYIAGSYRFLISIAAIAATIMFTWGAFQYLLGSAIPAVSQGKQIMIDAVVGLILVFSAHMILRTINPDTLTLAALHVSPIAAIELKNEDVLDPATMIQSGAAATPQTVQGTFLSWSEDELAGSEEIPAGGGGVTQPLTIKGFTMFQGPWATQPYGPQGVAACPGKDDRPFSQAGCCTTYARAGCGAASLATILATAGGNADPANIGAYLVSVGARKCNQGSGLGGNGIVSRAAQTVGASATGLGSGIAGVRSAARELRNGKPVMFLCVNCTGKTSTGAPKSYGGHYMVLNGVDPTGRIFSVFDVGNANPSGIVNISQKELATRTGGFWSAKK